MCVVYIYVCMNVREVRDYVCMGVRLSLCFVNSADFGTCIKYIVFGYTAGLRNEDYRSK